MGVDELERLLCTEQVSQAFLDLVWEQAEKLFDMADADDSGGKEGEQPETTTSRETA